MLKIRVADSHTGGEPTRTVLPGQFVFQSPTMAGRAKELATSQKELLRALVSEPRGSEAWVGAVLTPAEHEGSDLGVLFFNQAGPLGMCGHGTIGVAETLRYLEGTSSPTIQVDTSVGTVRITEHENGDFSFENVVSYRKATDVTVEVPGMGPVVGDVAYGGNWFFLVRSLTLSPDDFDADRWTAQTRAILHAVRQGGFPEVDHVEVFGPASHVGRESRNFVLCPSGGYDRSPCGTGTSAKLACLAADGLLSEGEEWQQESFVGSVFIGSYRSVEGGIIPRIRGRAHMMGLGEICFDPTDPFRWGIHG